MSTRRVYVLHSRSEPDLHYRPKAEIGCSVTLLSPFELGTPPSSAVASGPLLPLVAVAPPLGVLRLGALSALRFWPHHPLRSETRRGELMVRRTARSLAPQ